MDMKKELEDFGLRFAGAMLGMEEAATTEIIYRSVKGAANSFPYNFRPTNFAPGDNLVVGGLAIPPWVLGYLLEEDAEKKGDTKTKANGEALRKFGEGDMIHSWTMVLHNSLIRNISQTAPIQARVGQQSRPQPQPGGGSPASVVVKL